MALLPTTGPLAMAQINTVFSRGNDLGSYSNTSWYNANFQSGNFSNPLGYDQFYGKSPTQLPGNSWSNPSNSLPFTMTYGLAYNGNVFCLASFTGNSKIAVSSDGNSWTGYSPGNIAQGQRGIYWSGNYFYTGSNVANTLARSSDGINWSTVPMSSSAPTFYAAAQSSTSLAAIATSQVFTSNDGGNSWQRNASGSGILSVNGRAMTYGGNIFVMVGCSTSGGVGPSVVGVSTLANANTWTNKSTPINSLIGSGNGLLAVSYFNSKYIVAGANCRCATSSDTTTWSLNTNLANSWKNGNANANVIGSVVTSLYSDGTHLWAIGARANSSAICASYSLDGDTWYPAPNLSLAITGSNNANIGVGLWSGNAMCFNGSNLLVTVGTSNFGGIGTSITSTG